MPSLKQLAIVADVSGVQTYHLTLPRPPEVEYSEDCCPSNKATLVLQDQTGMMGSWTRLDHCWKEPVRA